MADEIENGLDRCWHREGVWGKEGRCPKLEEVVHCHNCDVFHAASMKVYDRVIPEDYRSEWSRLLAQEKERRVEASKSVLVFRIGDEWVAVPTVLCKEVTDVLKIHRLPHNRNRIIKGVVNINGEVQICFSLGNVLGISKAANGDAEEARNLVSERSVIMEKDGKRYVFPVSEVKGMFRYTEGALKEVPRTLSFGNFMKGVITCDGRHVGCIDEELLIAELDRSIR
jgi:chemotaxis-related protein WspD